MERSSSSCSQFFVFDGIFPSGVVVDFDFNFDLVRVYGEASAAVSLMGASCGWIPMTACLLLDLYGRDSGLLPALELIWLNVQESHLL